MNKHHVYSSCGKKLKWEIKLLISNVSSREQCLYRLVTAKSIGHLSTKILKYVFDIVVLIPALKIQGFE